MTLSPTLTTHHLAESDPRQHAFPHSLNTSAEELEEKEHVNQNRQIIGFRFRTMFVSFIRTPKKEAVQSAGLISFFGLFDPEIRD